MKTIYIFQMNTILKYLIYDKREFSIETKQKYIFVFYIMQKSAAFYFHFGHIVF